MNMNNDDKQKVFIKIGSILKDNRIQKGISLDDISNDLKIRIKQLECIEEGIGEHAIQGEYFLYNFIKKYSQYLNIWDDIYFILDESNVLSISKEIDFEKSNELKKYNKNKLLAKKYFFWGKFISGSLIACILIIGFIFWQKKSQETNSNKNLERIINTDKKLQTPAYPKVKNNAQVITFPLDKETQNLNNIKNYNNSNLNNRLKFQKELLQRNPNELTIVTKNNTLLIVKDSTGKEFINDVVPSDSMLNFLGIPPYSVIIGHFTGTRIYKGKYKVNINSDTYPDNKPVEITIN